MDKTTDGPSPAAPLQAGAIDIIVLLACSASLVVVAALRRDFIGDGLRHVPAALAASSPALGEPRWLLFPALIFLILRPLRLAGLVSSAEGAVQPLLWLSVCSGIVVLWSLRAWLKADRLGPRARAAALFLAASCAPFLTLFTDVAELQAGAALAVAGLTYARVQRERRPAGERGAVVAVAALAVSTLLYQGLALAFGMLPLAAGSAALRRRRVAATAVLAALVVPTVMVGARVAAGDPASLAFAMATQGERSQVSRTLMSRRSPAKYTVALAISPAFGFVKLASFQGVPALISDMRRRARGWISVLDALIVGAAAVMWLAIVATIVRRRWWALGLAAACLLVLPVMRNQQYSYPKFFVLWPVVVALAASRWRPRVAAAVAALLLAWNGSLTASEIQRGRRAYTAALEAYANATADTCWFTAGWGPALPYLWPGTVCSAPVMLVAGPDQAVQRQALTDALRRCFCSSDGVWTDTTHHDERSVGTLSGWFGYDEATLTSLLLDAARHGTISSDPLPIWAYSTEERRAICARLPSFR